jgi:hypothetical protein
MVPDALKKRAHLSMLTHDDIFDWEGWGGKMRLGSGRCRLRIFDLTKDKTAGFTHLRPIIVVISDIPESKMTIRSCSGHIATHVVKQFDIDPHRMLFVEYYPQKTYGEQNEHVIAERYEAVALTWHESRAMHPKWRTLKPPILDILKKLMDST